MTFFSDRLLECTFRDRDLDLVNLPPSISRPSDGVFCIGFVIARRPEIPACLTAFPRPTVLSLIMGGAQTKAFVLDLTPPAASKRHQGRIATDPLLTTRGFHQRRRGITTETTRLAGNRLGFHTVVCHRMACWGVGGPASSLVPAASEVPPTAHRSLLSEPLYRNPRRPPGPETRGGDKSTRDEPTLQSQTPSRGMETQSHPARRPESLPPQTDRSPHR